MEKKELKEEIKKVLEGKSIYEMSPISGLSPMTKEDIIYWIVETYIDQELDKAREEGYENGVKDGMKGRVFKRVHITEEYKPFKNRGELENFLSKLSGEGKWQDD